MSAISRPQAAAASTSEVQQPDWSQYGGGTSSEDGANPDTLLPGNYLEQSLEYSRRIQSSRRTTISTKKPEDPLKKSLFKFPPINYTRMFCRNEKKLATSALVGGAIGAAAATLVPPLVPLATVMGAFISCFGVFGTTKFFHKREINNEIRELQGLVDKFDKMEIGKALEICYVMERNLDTQDPKLRTTHVEKTALRREFIKKFVDGLKKTLIESNREQRGEIQSSKAYQQKVLQRCMEKLNKIGNSNFSEILTRVNQCQSEIKEYLSRLSSMQNLNEYNGHYRKIIKSILDAIALQLDFFREALTIARLSEEHFFTKNPDPEQLKKFYREEESIYARLQTGLAPLQAQITNRDVQQQKLDKVQRLLGENPESSQNNKVYEEASSSEDNKFTGLFSFKNFSKFFVDDYNNVPSALNYPPDALNTRQCFEEYNVEDTEQLDDIPIDININFSASLHQRVRQNLEDLMSVTSLVRDVYIVFYEDIREELLWLSQKFNEIIAKEEEFCQTVQLHTLGAKSLFLEHVRQHASARKNILIKQLQSVLSNCRRRMYFMMQEPNFVENFSEHRASVDILLVGPIAHGRAVPVALNAINKAWLSNDFISHDVALRINVDDINRQITQLWVALHLCSQLHESRQEVNLVHELDLLQYRLGFNLNSDLNQSVLLRKVIECGQLQVRNR